MKTIDIASSEPRLVPSVSLRYSKNVHRITNALWGIPYSQYTSNPCRIRGIVSDDFLYGS